MEEILYLIVPVWIKLFFFFRTLTLYIYFLANKVQKPYHHSKLKGSICNGKNCRFYNGNEQTK